MYLSKPLSKANADQRNPESTEGMRWSRSDEA